MKCSINGDSGLLEGPFTLSFLKVIAQLTGKKKWTTSSSVEFVANKYNLGILGNHEIAMETIQSPVISDDDFDKHILRIYTPKLPLRDFQQECVDLSWNQEAYAIFMDCGLGKTCTMVCNVGKLVAAGLITAVIIVAPNGVYEQWVEDEIPKHADPNLQFKFHVWDGETDIEFGKSNAHCEILAMNFEALRIKKEKRKGGGRRKIISISKGHVLAEQLIKAHGGKVLIIVDESHRIKSYKSQCTQSLFVLGKQVNYRRIMTGTPIANNLLDFWTQFYFLHPNILGYDNIVAYRNHFCIMGGYENHQIVGEQNIEELYSIIAPYSYRKTKSEVTDLPEKIYIERPYVMSDDTARHYRNMKNMWLTRFDDGTIKDAKTGLVAMLRLQQIVCGYLEREDGTVEQIGKGERLDAMMEICNQVTGQVIIWARFTQDIENICKRLNEERPGEGVVPYYGDVSRDQRDWGKKQFINGEARFFVGNIGISAGLDGLQCAGSMIFYSCDFNAIHRWQAEDRAHRFGMVGLTIFDLIARCTIDRPILRNLAGKKDLSSLTLDKIRQAIAEA